MYSNKNILIYLLISLLLVTGCTRKSPEQRFIEACSNGKYDLMLTFLTQGVDKNTQLNGTTCLMAAAGRGHQDIVEKLLALNADIGLTDREGNTAVDYAIHYGYPQIAEMILSRQQTENRVPGRNEQRAVSKEPTAPPKEPTASPVDPANPPPNLLAIREHAKTNGTLTIRINPPQEFDFKGKNEIYDIRTKYVQRYPKLLYAGYWPSKPIFGDIVSEKPWWGLLGLSYYGDGQKSIEGPSEESRFIVNPFLLVGLTDKYARRIPAENFTPHMIYPEPINLTWNAETAFAAVKYNISAYWKKYAESYSNLSFSELNAFTLVAYNARDFELNFLYIVPNKSEHIVPQNHPENAVFIAQMLHCGGSCGYPGGCNNMSPTMNEMEIAVTQLPAMVYIKLWRNNPKDINHSPDMTFVIQMI